MVPRIQNNVDATPGTALPDLAELEAQSSKHAMDGFTSSLLIKTVENKLSIYQTMYQSILF